MYKVVVFDLDETLGYFAELGIFWKTINNFINFKKIKYNLSQEDFNDIMGLYPEFERPYIIDILNYLKNKKIKNQCYKIIIYTNNQGGKTWVEYIKKYFENKINYNLFDEVLSAFIIGDINEDSSRKSNIKTYKDLVKCTKLPFHSQIFFLDDVYHSKMALYNVYYINIKPYIYLSLIHI